MVACNDVNPECGKYTCPDVRYCKDPFPEGGSNTGCECVVAPYGKWLFWLGVMAAYTLLVIGVSYVVMLRARLKRPPKEDEDPPECDATTTTPESDEEDDEEQAMIDQESESDWSGYSSDDSVVVEPQYNFGDLLG